MLDDRICCLTSSVFTRSMGLSLQASEFRPSDICHPTSVIGSNDQAFDRAISTGQHRDCSLCTSGLSTWWSTTALSETWFRGGLPA